MKFTVLILLPDYATPEWPHDALIYQEVEPDFMQGPPPTNIVVEAAIYAVATDLGYGTDELAPMAVVVGGKHRIKSPE